MRNLREQGTAQNSYLSQQEI